MSAIDKDPPDRNIYTDIEEMVKDFPEPMRTNLSRFGSVLRDKKHSGKEEPYIPDSQPSWKKKF